LPRIQDAISSDTTRSVLNSLVNGVTNYNCDACKKKLYFPVVVGDRTMVIGCQHATPPKDMRFVILRQVDGDNPPCTHFIRELSTKARDDFGEVYKPWSVSQPVFIKVDPRTCFIDYAPAFALLFLATFSLVSPAAIVTEMKQFGFIDDLPSSQRGYLVNIAVAQVSFLYSTDVVYSFVPIYVCESVHTHPMKILIKFLF
jgi:hypothetical protein